MSSLKSKVESILFISNRPLSVKKLAELTKSEPDKINQALEQLAAEYGNPDRGVILQRIGSDVQMATAGESAGAVKEFIKMETTGELTRAALETLTIVVYRGPIGRAELEQIRGVNCAIILRNLLIRGLVTSEARKEKLETVYQVSLDFLKFLGLRTPQELPDYEKLNSSENIEKLLQQKNQSTQ